MCASSGVQNFFSVADSSTCCFVFFLAFVYCNLDRFITIAQSLFLSLYFIIFHYNLLQMHHVGPG